MSLRNLGIVYRKELRDLLRDRRTVISMIVVPMLVIPLLTAGVGALSFHQVKAAITQTERIMILGGDDSAKTTAALRKLDNVEFVPADPDYKKMISDKKIGAAVEIPPGFEAALNNGAPATVHIYDYQGEIRSETAARTLRDFFQNWRDTTVNDRLAARNLPADLLKPFDVQTDNVAPPEKISGNEIGAFIPYLILMMCVAGAIYPAIDLTAGEKERGTMETILSSPVRRIHLVLGKCLMVMTASFTTMVLSLTSTGISLFCIKYFGADLTRNNGFNVNISPVSLLEVLVIMLPMTVLFASVLLAIGLFARNTKEANSYLQPLMMLIVFPAMLSLLPGFELNYHLAFIPVVNVSLLSKEILSGTFHWNYIAVVFGSSCAYAAVALTVAVRLFKRESVIFRA
ncbi:MAG TPA: ABC transporter permease [Opitutales bacterium]|jgi:sodium transport system permease protein|nr:ABC transporter permease [Opitutales bacterium]